jgi:hypothetical protein
MRAKVDDVDKLLGEIELKDFGYRSYGRGDSKALRIVRSSDAESAQGIVAISAGASAPASSGQDIVAAAAVSPAVVSAVVAPPPKPAIASPQVAATIRVNEAFERLARVPLVPGSPRLRLRLELPPRPALLGPSETQQMSERSWRSVFDRLSRAALPTATATKTLSGS